MKTLPFLSVYAHIAPAASFLLSSTVVVAVLALLAICLYVFLFRRQSRHAFKVLEFDKDYTVINSLPVRGRSRFLEVCVNMGGKDKPDHQWCRIQAKLVPNAICLRPGAIVRLEHPKQRTTTLFQSESGEIMAVQPKPSRA